MRRLFSAILSMALLCLAFSSCEKDDTILYTTFSVGNVTNGVFVSDEGTTFNITEQICEGRLDTMKRAFIVCDVLGKTKGQKDAVNARLKEIHTVLTKDVLMSNEIDDKVIGTNPVNVANAWLSKGYFNILFNFTYFAESKTKHFINLVVDKEKSTDSDLVLQLRHNGYGETLDKASDEQISRVKVGSGYASFKTDDLIPEGKDKINVTINWAWHAQMGGVIDKEIVPLSATGVLQR